MSKIKILAEEVTNKIAAGEIIERPVSIVKELVENSIDAESTKITVVLENGGKKKIQVIDDGKGMDEEDALLTFERHATSKIRNVEDIVTISSMGFRGEAIPSIASVSKLSLITKTVTSETATNVETNFGIIKDVKKCSSNTGTDITVTRLFDNLPVRKKFLKSDQVEFRYIADYIHYQALVFPNIGFRLVHNGNERINYPAVREKMNRYTAVLGSNFLKHNFLPIESEPGLVSISGFISGLEDTGEKIGDFRYLFINGRYIRDKIIYHSINTAYEPFIKKFRIYNKGKLPPYVLFLQISPELVDVNVHPAKLEVRFRDPHLVHSFVKNSITQTLLESQENKFSPHPASHTIDETTQQPLEVNDRGDEGKGGMIGQGKGSMRLQSDRLSLGSGSKYARRYDAVLNELYQPDLFKSKENRIVADIPRFDQKAVPTDIFIPEEADLVNPWQLHDSYVLFQCEDGVIFIDQHAAHERILYEELLHRMSGAPAVSQQLLFPILVDIPPILATTIKELLDENMEMLEKIGFSISSFSGDTLVINEIPAELSDWEGGEVFKDILFQLQDEFQQTKNFRDSIAKAVSCKAAIKVNNRLGSNEMLKLINDLFACKVPYFCPHGRPILIKLTLTDLERKFKRI